MSVNKISEDLLIEMSDVRGCKVENPHRLNFSFYFSSKSDENQVISVKPSFNPEKLKLSQTGTLKLCGNWEYIPGSEDKNVPQSEISKMKDFFRDNIVLFVLVWDEFLQDALVSDYFLGRADLEELLDDLEFASSEKLTDEFRSRLKSCTSIADLDVLLRANLDLLNMAGFAVDFCGS